MKELEAILAGETSVPYVAPAGGAYSGGTSNKNTRKITWEGLKTRSHFDAPYYMAQMEQANIMRARKQQRELEPYYLAMQGLKYDEGGSLVPMGELERITSLKGIDPLAGLQYEQQLKAMRGEIPVSPALERDITGSEEIARETMARRGQLEGSTPWAQTTAGLAESANIAREAARRGALGEGFQQMMAYRQSAQAMPSGVLQQTMGLQPYYGMMYERGQQQQQQMAQQALMTKQLRLQRETGWLSTIGGVAGIAAGAYLGAPMVASKKQ
jgi:hypothetical protein